MSLKSTLRKAAGLLVELPPEEYSEERAEKPRPSSKSATDQLFAELEAEAKAPHDAPPAVKTVEQIVRDIEGPNLNQIAVPTTAPPSYVNPDGSPNFGAIYQATKLPAAPFTAEQILEMFSALPSDLPLEIKRQTIRVSINAMGKSIGANPENIVADASRKLAALASYSEHLSKTTGEFISLSEQKIAILQAQMEETRKSIDEAQKKLEFQTTLCTQESERLDDVLEFFSLDVAPSKYAP
ncbi:hypothetical protein LBMAG21_14820 [Armatimonadota bacterium]|nr:hypothetical protein LBMAG21_14820 [Armatimonadota bacterium]